MLSEHLGGLVKISGRADFFRESTSLENEETFDIIYKTTSYSDLIPIRVEQDYSDLCTSNDATHVVSQVLYGQREYLSLRHKPSKNSKVQNIKGNLEVVVKSIFKTQRRASSKIMELNKDLVDTTEAILSGDFSIHTFPRTFTDGINAFKDVVRK